MNVRIAVWDKHADNLSPDYGSGFLAEKEIHPDEYPTLTRDWKNAVLFTPLEAIVAIAQLLQHDRFNAIRVIK